MNEDKEMGMPLSVALIDAEYITKNPGASPGFGILPVWRWFWQEITCAGGKIDFMQSGFDSPYEFAAQLKDSNYDIILIHLDNYIPVWLTSLVSVIREAVAGISIILCGFLPTIKSKEILEALPGVKMIIPGPLEESLSYLSGKPENVYMPGNVNKLQEADPEILKRVFFKTRAGMLQASAGCPMSCSFCRYSSFYHQYYPKIYSQYRIENVIHEIYELNHRFSITHFKFCDSNFLGSRKTAYKRACELAGSLLNMGLEITFEIHCRSDALNNEIISSLAASGLRHLGIGIESMSPCQLERYEKRETVMDHKKAVELVSQYGITAQGYCILADPLVTREELLESLEGLYEISKKILILIHEKMTLYSTTKYYNKYYKSIRGLSSDGFSLGATVRYEFLDQWCKNNFKIFEETSLWLKHQTLAFQKINKPDISTMNLYIYIREATSYRIELLKRIVREDNPDTALVVQWRKETMERIQSLL